MTILTTISTTIQREGLIQAGDMLVLAVSGGPDSLAMLYALHALRSRFDFQIHVAHLDHQLRPESADEADFVAGQAHTLGLAYTISRMDVGAEARRIGLNEYAAGRRARYHMLTELATQIGAASVAVAHSAHDQAETLLLHLLRGAGTEGLAAMTVSTPWEQWAVPGFGEWGSVRPETGDRKHERGASLIRPLLEVSRAQVEAYCAELALEPRRDPANQDRRHMRSRIRHDLLPQLIEYNPHIVEALCRTAAICHADQAFIQAQLDNLWTQLVSVQEREFVFRGAIWQTLPVALQRAALRRAYAALVDPTIVQQGERLSKSHTKALLIPKTLELSHIEELRRLISAGVGRKSTLPGGIQLEVAYSQDFRLGFLSSQKAARGPQLSQAAYALELPASIDLAGWRFYASLEEQAQEAHDNWEIWLAPQTITGKSLTLRRRKPGDRIYPAGGAGRRSIQDLMVDAKIPRELRAAWPVLTADEHVVWVPGLRAAQGVSCAAGQGPALWVRVVTSDE